MIGRRQDIGPTVYAWYTEYEESHFSEDADQRENRPLAELEGVIREDVDRIADDCKCLFTRSASVKLIYIGSNAEGLRRKGIARATRHGLSRRC